MTTTVPATCKSSGCTGDKQYIDTYGACQTCNTIINHYDATSNPKTCTPCASLEYLKDGTCTNCSAITSVYKAATKTTGATCEVCTGDKKYINKSGVC